MALTFAGTLDRSAVLAAVDQLTGSQPECAVEFLTTAGPSKARVLTLVDHYDRVDWLRAPVDAPENTSIRDDFNQLGSAGPHESVDVLARSRENLGAAMAAAGPTTYVPWQDCALPTDDFLVVRLMEIVVHADDLACSIGLAAPVFSPEVLEPVLALLAALAVRRRGQETVLRTLSRHERSAGCSSAF